MRIAVPRETAPGERRVALVPDAVKRLASVGFEVAVERGAGREAGFSDDVFEDAGATVVGRDELFLSAGAVVRVAPPSDADLEGVGAGMVLIGFLDPLGNPSGLERLAARGIHAFAMESIPRISRAQSMERSRRRHGGRLQGRDARGRPAAAVLPAADDGGGHDRAGEGARARRGRRGAPGDRHRAPPRRGRLGVRHPSRGPGAGREPRRNVRRPRRAGAETEGGYAIELTPEQQAQKQAALEERSPTWTWSITTALVPGGRRHA